MEDTGLKKSAALNIMRFKLIEVIAASIIIGLLATMLLPSNYNVVASPNIISLSTTQVQSITPKTIKIGSEKYQVIINDETVIIGKDTATFVPEINMYRFGDEASLTLYEPLINNTSLNQKNSSTTMTIDTVRWESRDIQFIFYPTVLNGENTSYGFEYELIIASSKAGTNALLDSIVFPIATQNLVFYYQPPLTDEMNSGWSDRYQTNITVTATQVINNITGEILEERPNDVVGSYAVYHTSKRDGNYGTGKAFHIYRPKLIDAQGATAYADLSIGDGSLTLSFTKLADWLNKAKYPVVIDPTFGYTGAGGSYDTWSTNSWVGTTATSPSDAATGTSWIIYASAAMHTDGGTGNMKGVIYLASNNTRVTNGTGAVSSQITSTKGWATSTYDTAPTVSNSTSYKIGPVIGNASTGVFRLYYDATGPGGYDTSVSYASPDATIDPNSINRNHSTYASYTSAGGTSITNSPVSIAFGTLAALSTFWSNNTTPGYTPSWDLADAQSYFTVTNNGTVTENISISSTNWTGGVGWVITTGNPGENTVRMSAFKSGDNSTAGIALTGAPQLFVTNLTASGTKKWELKLETGTFTDGANKSSTVTLTASSP